MSQLFPTADPKYDRYVGDDGIECYVPARRPPKVMVFSFNQLALFRARGFPSGRDPATGGVAGRALDAEIAEKVFGWKLTAPVDPNCGHCVGQNRNGSSAKRNYVRNHEGEEIVIPEFSREIASAWLVVERLHTPQRSGKVWFPQGERHWVCRFYDSNGEIEGSAGADTAPLAICLAALKALGAAEPGARTPGEPSR